MGKNYLTAEEARKMSVEAKYFLNHIFKVIKDCANCGGSKIIFTGDNMTDEAVKTVVKTLEELGYTVEICNSKEVSAVEESDVPWVLTNFIVSW